MDVRDLERKTVGYGDCPNGCGVTDLPVKADKKGHLYIYCKTPADGGCGGGLRGTARQHDALVAKRVKKWVKAEYRAVFLGVAPASPADPAPADPPKADPPKVDPPKADPPADDANARAMRDLHGE